MKKIRCMEMLQPWASHPGRDQREQHVSTRTPASVITAVKRWHRDRRIVAAW